MTVGIDPPELLENLNRGVLTLTLNRPDRLNALNRTLMKLLVEAVSRAAVDSDVGCVVLTGAGHAFCAGGDMKASAEARSQPRDERAPDDFEKRREWLRRSMEAARLLHDMPKPTIAMINGVCAGAGFSLAGACDLRIAGESAVLTSAFVKAGLSGDYGGSWFWTRIAGSRARELYLLSEKIKARDALAAGLVSAVYPDGLLLSETNALAHRFADGPRVAHRHIKSNLNAAECGTMEEVFGLEVENMLLSRRALGGSRSA